MVELSAYPQAMAYVHCRKISVTTTADMITGVFAYPDGRKITLYVDVHKSRFWFDEEG